MEETDFISPARIAIVGLGLMGGSLAMALRGRCLEILGVDPDPVAANLALERQVVDRAACRPEDILPLADVIVLAAPVRAILAEIGRLPDLHPGPAVVLDLGSTKQAILQAMESLPERFDPIGCHPMCGKEKGSLANADPSLFKGAPFALAPLARTSPAARRLALQLAEIVGARPLFIDAPTHDRWVAGTSHLPYLVANALAQVVSSEAAPLVGTGLRSTTRLAPSPLTMMLDVLATNRENVLEALIRFREAIEGLEADLCAEDYDDLAERLANGALNYRKLTG